MIDQHKTIKDLCLKVRAEGLDIDVIRLWEAFYQQDRNKWGSFKPYIQTDFYDSLMIGRYSRIESQILDVIQSKKNYLDVERARHEFRKRPQGVPHPVTLKPTPPQYSKQGKTDGGEDGTY